jgi:hypothetical protein
MASDKSFNLLKPIEPPKTYWDKIYDWILTRARIVLLIVVVIIIGTFFAKVAVDNIGKNKIQQFTSANNKLLGLSTQYEADFRRTQFKNDEYLKLWNGSSAYAQILDEIYAYLPNPSNQFSVTIADNTILITGSDGSAELELLEDLVKSSETFNSESFRVTREQREVEQETGKFILEATISEDFLTRNNI